MKISGLAHKYGDNVNTDVIIPARYCNTIDPLQLAAHCLEDLDPEFVNKVKPGDILVGGSNFGCGSSREVAPLAIKHSGISCVVALSFARIFYRNAVNIGLPVIECPGLVENSSPGHEVEINLEQGIIVNRTTGKAYPFPKADGVIGDIISSGGLVNYVKKLHTQTKK